MTDPVWQFIQGLLLLVLSVVTFRLQVINVLQEDAPE
jgi:hypothetical protein